MNSLEKINLLSDLIIKGEGLEKESASTPEFKAWHHQAERRLIKIYGENSFEIVQFQNIKFLFKPMVVSLTGTPLNFSPEYLKCFREGMQTAIGYFQSYISDFEYQLNQLTDEGFNIFQDVNGAIIGSSKIFISHASKDKDIVEELIELLEVIGVKSSQIFCSSFEGYGIPLGENFLEIIKAQLTNDSLVLFVLTENFYQSAVCMCEMGAAWVLSKKHIPIVVPPLNYADIRGVIPNTQGLIINDAQKLNLLKQQIETQFQINGQENSVGWERKRNRILERINEHIADVKN